MGVSARLPSPAASARRRRLRGAQLWRTVALAVASTAAVLLAVSVTAGCSTTTPGSSGVDSREVSEYRVEQSASASAARRDTVVALCRQATSSMVVMVRGFNTFVDRLNAVHTYDRVGELDDQARASLIAGVDQIRGKLSDAIPADVTAPITTFLGSSARLGDAIARRELDGINPIATSWTRDKEAVLAACSAYLPAPPGLVPTSAGPPTG